MIKKYSFIIGIIIFLLILNKLGFREIIDVLDKIDLCYFSLAIFLLLPLLLIKAYRWNYLKKKQNIISNFKDSFLVNNIGVAIGLVTPGRLGELTKILYLKNRGYSTGQSLVSVLMDRLADLFFLLFFSLISLVLFFSYFKKTILLSALILFLFTLIFVLVLKNNLVQIILKKILNLIIPLKYKKAWSLNYHDFFKNLKIYTLTNYFSILLITILAWLIYYFQSFLLAKSIGINIPFFYLIMIITVAGFIALLPISVSGLGTREATLIFFFSFFQVPLEKTVGFSLLILSMVLIIALIGLICWSIKSIRF